MDYIVEMTRTTTLRTYIKQADSEYTEITMLQTTSFILEGKDLDDIDEKMELIIERNEILDAYWEPDIYRKDRDKDTTEIIETVLNLEYSATLIPLLTYADITDIEEEESDQ